MDLPLDGIRVVSLEHAVAGPIATRHMADMGADVVKVERPGDGDFARGYDRVVHGQASFFVWLNRGKRSLALDLKGPDAPDILHRLLSRADILIQNLAPGATARLGLDWATVHAAHPRLTLCDISGFGATGPYAGRKSYDLLIQAESGVMGVSGTPEQPSRVGISAADIATGMYAFSGCLAALVRRGRTGQGTHVEVAMLDTLSEWMGAAHMHAVYGAGSPERRPSSHPALSPYGTYPAADGTVLFGIQNDREWATFCARVLEQPALATEPPFATNTARVANRAALDAVIGAVFAPLTVDAVEARLLAANIAFGRVRDAVEAAAHPQHHARGRWQEVQTPGGPIQALVPPWLLDGETLPMLPVPALGEHTEAILAEIGYGRSEAAD